MRDSYNETDRNIINMGLPLHEPHEGLTNSGFIVGTLEGMIELRDTLSAAILDAQKTNGTSYMRYSAELVDSKEVEYVINVGIYSAEDTKIFAPRYEDVC